MESLNLENMDPNEWREWIFDKDLRGPFRDTDGQWWLDRRYNIETAESMGYRFPDWSIAGPAVIRIPEELYDSLGLPKSGTINYTKGEI